MDTSYYLGNFRQVVNRLDKKLLAEKDVEASVGVVLDSVFLKLYKRSWASPSSDPLTAESRIFFSIWINDETIEKKRISYNIHAFKLRKLKGYSIESRKFAELFRKGFKKFESKWENVSVKYGPLTLMEGWIDLNEQTMQRDVLELCRQFLEIEYLVEETLAHFRQTGKK